MFDLFNFGGGNHHRGIRHYSGPALPEGKPVQIVETAVIVDRDGEVSYSTKDAMELEDEGTVLYVGYRQIGHIIEHHYYLADPE